MVMYLIVLFWVTGCFSLFIDGNRYKDAEMIKELKIVRILGWFNLIAGCLVFIGNWVIEKFVW